MVQFDNAFRQWQAESMAGFFPDFFVIGPEKFEEQSMETSAEGTLERIQDTLKDMMEDADFCEVEYHDMTGGIVALHRGIKA